MLARRFDKQIRAGDQHGARRADARHLQRGVLPGLADLQVERARPVDDAPAMAGEPGQHRGGQLGGKAVVAGVRRRTHPIVEDSFGGLLRQVECAAVEKPVAPRQAFGIERTRQRGQPGLVLVDDVDMHHRVRSVLSRKYTFMADKPRQK
jgi:hypothetical protein